jgi:hypothetical protein
MTESISDKDGQLVGLRIRFRVEDVTEESIDELKLTELEREIFFNDPQEVLELK